MSEPEKVSKLSALGGRLLKFKDEVSQTVTKQLSGGDDRTGSDPDGDESPRIDPPRSVTIHSSREDLVAFIKFQNEQSKVMKQRLDLTRKKLKKSEEERKRLEEGRRRDTRDRMDGLDKVRKEREDYRAQCESLKGERDTLTDKIARLQVELQDANNQRSFVQGELENLQKKYQRLLLREGEGEKGESGGSGGRGNETETENEKEIENDIENENENGTNEQSDIQCNTNTNQQSENQTSPISSNSSNSSNSSPNNPSNSVPTQHSKQRTQSQPIRQSTSIPSTSTSLSPSLSPSPSSVTPSDISSLQEENKLLRQMQSKWEKEHKEYMQCKREIDALKWIKSKTEGDLANQTTRLETMRKTLLHMGGQEQEGKQKMASYELTIEQHTRELASAKEQLQQQTNTVMELRDTHAQEIETLHGTYRERIDALERECAQHKSAIQTARSGLREALKKESQMQHQMDDLKHVVERVEKERDVAMEKMQQLQRENATAQQQIRDITTELETATLANQDTQQQERIAELEAQQQGWERKVEEMESMLAHKALEVKRLRHEMIVLKREPSPSPSSSPQSSQYGAFNSEDLQDALEQLQWVAQGDQEIVRDDGVCVDVQKCVQTVQESVVRVGQLLQETDQQQELFQMQVDILKDELALLQRQNQRGDLMDGERVLYVRNSVLQLLGRSPSQQLDMLPVLADLLDFTSQETQQVTERLEELNQRIGIMM